MPVLPWSMEVEALAAMRTERRPHAVLDVREAWELAICRFADSIDIPLGQLPLQAAQLLARLPADRPMVVVCHHGMRSAQATQWLRANGYDNAVNLSGGVDAYARRVDPGMQIY